MYRLRWYCCAILNGGRFGDLRTIYQGCRALPFALAGLSCLLTYVLTLLFADTRQDLENANPGFTPDEDMAPETPPPSYISIARQTSYTSNITQTSFQCKRIKPVYFDIFRSGTDLISLHMLLLLLLIRLYETPDCPECSSTCRDWNKEVWPHYSSAAVRQRMAMITYKCLHGLASSYVADVFTPFRPSLAGGSCGR